LFAGSLGAWTIRQIIQTGLTHRKFAGKLKENSEITQRHIAGMRFLTEYDSYKHNSKSTKAQAEELLQLAEQAIKKQPDPTMER
jgi:hypothetical protein